MSTINIKINTMSMDWCEERKIGTKIEGIIHINNKKSMNFYFHKNRLNLLPSEGNKIVPEITNEIKVVIKNLLVTYIAGTAHRDQFEIYTVENEYEPVDCSLEE